MSLERQYQERGVFSSKTPDSRGATGLSKGRLMACWPSPAPCGLQALPRPWPVAYNPPGQQHSISRTLLGV